MSKICIIGNDERSNYLRKKYKEENADLGHYSSSDYVVTPIPFTRDNYYITEENIKVDELIFSLKKRQGSVLITGALNKECIEKLKINGIKYYDIMENEEFLLNNSVATAEGTIKTVMENSVKTIKDTSFIVIGYGRIGRELTRLLKSFNSDVTVVTRRKEVIDELGEKKIKSELTSNLEKIVKGKNIIINTAPAIFLNKKVLEKVSSDTIIIDVASKPGGVDFIEAEKRGLKVLWELGIPSKYSPDSASMYVKNEVDKIIKKESLNV